MDLSLDQIQIITIKKQADLKTFRIMCLTVMVNFLITKPVLLQLLNWFIRKKIVKC